MVIEGVIMKKRIGIILIIIGLMPILYTLISGLYHAIFGWNGLCFMCPNEYGIKVFFDYVLLFGMVYWPILLSGLIVAIIGYLLTKKKSNSIQEGNYEVNNQELK